MPPTAPRPPKFEFVGGSVALDFANTVGGLRGEGGRDYLEGYGDLALWAAQAGLFGGGTVRSLQLHAEQDPPAAARALARARAGREALYAIFSAGAAGKAAPADSLALLNEELPAALRRLRLKATKAGFAWELAGDDAALDLPLWAVLRAAADLLASPQLAQVRECAGDRCSWLFRDATRNHSRVWCSMDGCGNRAKVRRHRQRHPPPPRA